MTVVVPVADKAVAAASVVVKVEAVALIKETIEAAGGINISL